MTKTTIKSYTCRVKQSVIDAIKQLSNDEQIHQALVLERAVQCLIQSKTDDRQNIDNDDTLVRHSNDNVLSVLQNELDIKNKQIESMQKNIDSLNNNISQQNHLLLLRFKGNNALIEHQEDNNNNELEERVINITNSPSKKQTKTKKHKKKNKKKKK